MGNPTKYCSSCGEMEPLSAFGKEKKNKDGLSYSCKECIQIYRGTRLNSSDSNRKSYLKLNYGITPQDYNRIFEKQKGCCAICGSHQSDFSRRLGVDHNHKTGKIRGLLCTNCNQGLGKFKDSRGCLIKAIQYLKKHI